MFHTFGPLVRQYLVVITVNLSVLGTGLGLAWPSPVLVKLRNATETVLSQPLTEEQGSWVVSVGFLTGILANVLAVLLVDRIGRKFTIFLACVPKIASGLLYVFATDVWMLLLGRAIAGASDAIVFTVLPMYASEVASKDIRGSLGTILQIVSSIGVVSMLCMGPFIPYLTLNVIYTVAIIATTMPLLFLPHSPYFLYSKGRNAEALEVLTFLRGSETLASDELKEYSLQTTSSKTTTMEIIRNKTFLKSFILVMVLTIGAQLSGFNSVSFYLQTILESTETSITPEVCSVIIGLIQLLASFCTTLMTDRFGRKPILTSTLSGLAVGMVGLGAFFYVKTGGPVSGFMNFLPLISLVLVVYCYSAGVGSINWVLSAELFDDRSRGVGLSITSLISYIVLFLTTKFFPFLLIVVGPAATYWFFSVCCVIVCLLVMYFVPETKGKSFAEIQYELGARESKETASYF